MLFLYGAYGTGNLGDDVILKAALQTYQNHDCRIICYGKPRINERIEIIDHYDFVNDPAKYLVAGDELVFAGGGLFWADQHIEEMCRSAEVAKGIGCIVRIERVGAQGIEIAPETARKLFNTCDAITVRDPDSVALVNELGVKPTVTYQRDYAFELQGRRTRLLRPDRIQIGLSHSAQSFFFDADHRNKAILIYYEIALRCKEIADLVYVPHVRHYNVASENDVIYAEYFWQGSGGLITPLPMPESVEQLTEIYRSLDGMFAWRYHALALATRAGVPAAYIGELGANKYCALAQYYGLPQIDFALPVTDVVESAMRFVKIIAQARDFSPSAI